ncbi:type II secretion system protein GspM [Benzoatithermus flavus]|uniref:Type II secretion system protein GspM n=1 Tax=Benzoatithermus flavus TaxID=3108223 RepID=A0ABU8XQ56_9PROT
MIERLPPRQRRYLALLILVAAVIVLCGILYLPFAYLQRQEAALAAGQRRIAELRARVPLREELLAQERRLKESGDLKEALLPGSTPAVAAAQLQGDLSGLAAAMGGEIATVQILDPEEAAPFVRIGLRLTMSGDIATMRDFLYAVETRNPVLVVRSMDLASRSEAGMADENPTLNGTFEIFGYAPRSIMPEGSTPK